MWDCAPSARDALDLLARVTRRAIEVGGAMVTGLAALLTALHERPALRR